MNVLSLFNGYSGAKMALDVLGIKVDKYYSSETDKYTNKVTQALYPDTIHLGDIRKIDTYSLPVIDLLIGGSPCQGFSFAGKQLNFDDPRSKLFFNYIDILGRVVPKYFLLENVKMKKEYQDIISQYLGVHPIEINSAFVSAQNRKRLYWTNIPNIKQPVDKSIYLKDIIEHGLRNSTLTALMPCESSSLVTNSTNGIEPPRSLVTVKKSKQGLIPQVVPEILRLKK